MKSHPRLLLRSEPFGGIIAENSSSRVRFLNHSAYSIFKQILKGFPKEAIFGNLKREFYIPADSMDIVNEDIDNSLRLFESENLFQDKYNELNYGESLPVLELPLDLQLEITRRCNFSCLHCYNESGHDGQELPLEYITKFLEPFYKKKLRSVTIIGGEPLIHSHINQIMKLCSDVAENIYLSTNGFFLRDEDVSAVVKYIDNVNISIDAPTSELHDSFRNCSGAFENAMRTLRTLKQAGMIIVVQTSIFKGNIDHLQAFGELLVKEGVDVWSIRIPFRSGRARENISLFLDEDEIRSREHELDKLRETFSNDMQIYAGVPVPWSRREKFKKINHRDQFVTCAAGTVLAALLATGKLTPCILFSGTGFGDILEKPEKLRETWQGGNSFKKLRQLRLFDIEPCRYCSHFNSPCKCSCRAKAFISGGDIALADPDCDFF